MGILVKIGLALVIGLIGGKLAKKVKLPNVTGYLLAGLLVGPAILPRLFGGNIYVLNIGELKALDFISELALAFIAFSIGSEFVIRDMVKYGKKVLVITVAEVLGAVILVFSVMYFLFNQDFAFSIVIASMSAATAPAATLLVMRQFRAYGPMTKTLLSVVALDDVVGIIVFGICMALAKMHISQESITVGKILFGEIKNGVFTVGPVLEILGSLVLGLILGLILTMVAKKQKERDRDDLQVMAIIAILLGVGIASLLGLSPLLTNIVIGMTLVNLMKKSGKVFESVNDFVAPFYVLFFTFAGAKLDLDVLVTVGGIGVAYVFARGLGKYIGAFVGGKMIRADKATTHYLGLGLLPQGGVSIGLSVIVASQLDKIYSDPIITIIMASVLVYETTGPIFSKLSISLAGELYGLDRINENNENNETETNKEAELALQAN